MGDGFVGGGETHAVFGRDAVYPVAGVEVVDTQNKIANKRICRTTVSDRGRQAGEPERGAALQEGAPRDGRQERDHDHG